MRHVYDLGIKRTVNSGSDTAFWLDHWIGDCSLYCLYPNLFQIASNQTLTVDETFSSNSTLILSFNRQLTGITLTEWYSLRRSITFTYNIGPDLISWKWTTHCLFTVHSLYKWLEFGGLKNNYFTTI